MKISMSKGRLLAVLALLLGCALLWRGFFEPGRQRGMPQDTPPVRVATALAQDMPHFLNGLGTVEPSSDVLVTSRVDGHLQRLHFTEGQFVHKGDLLAEIAPRPFEAALGEARGALARDTAQLENARRDLARYEKLVSGGHIARQQYDNQRALVRQYEGTVQSDKAAVDSAALQLQYSRITAPADGVLGLRKVDEGNMVHASDTEGLVRITLLTPSYVVFTLPESRVPLVAQHWREARKSGGRLLVQAWDREQQALLAQGFLLSMDNQIDTATGTVKLKAEFANEDHTLFPNQFVNARLLVTVLPQAVTVPTAAVQLGSRGSYVYVVDKDTVRLREVTPGVRTDSLTVIDKGLAAGEVVVVDADYSQIELRVLAHISQDEHMIEAFKHGQDIHAATAAKVYHVPLEEVTPQMRSSCKAVNFGIVYGISDFSLAQDIGVTRKEAGEFIKTYLDTYPGVKKYMEDIKQTGREQGYVSTLFGRRRALPELKSKNFNMRSFGERVAMNTPIQGTAADIIKIAMVRVRDRLLRDGLQSRLILQVHDELILEAPKDEQETAMRLLTEEMEHAFRMDAPLVAEAKAGHSWYDAK